MKLLVFLFCFCFCSLLHGQPTTHSDSITTIRMNSLTTRLSELEHTIEAEHRINDKTFSSISIQLSTSSYVLSIMGIVFAVVAIGVGVYVTYVERKILKISEENKDLLNKNLRIKKEVQELNDLIQGDIYSLYEKLRQQENVELLNRLIRVPKDIANISSLLFSRDLRAEDFEKLRKAYFNLGVQDGLYKSSYKLLFFQHFLTDTLKDDSLRTEITEYLPQAITSSFENDLVKSAHDFVVAVVDKGLNNFKVEVNKFFMGLSMSQLNHYHHVYISLFDTLKTRQNRFDFLNLVDSSNENRIAKVEFGKLLINEYSQVSPTTTEKLALQEVAELEDSIRKDEEKKEDSK